VNADPLRALCAAGTGLHDGEYACVQILARPASPHRMRRARQAAARLRRGNQPTTGGLDPGALVRGLLGLFTTTSRQRPLPRVRRARIAERAPRPIQERAPHPRWATGIRYTVAATNSRGGDPAGRLNAVAAALAAAFAVYTGRNRLTHRTRMRHPVQVMADRR